MRTLTPRGKTGTMEPMTPFIVEREAVGRALTDELLTADRYVVSCEVDGRIVLAPITTDDSTQMRLLADAEFRSLIEEQANEPAELLDLDNF